MPDWQTLVAIFAVALAGGFLLRGIWRACFGKSKGCCGGCAKGCTSNSNGSQPLVPLGLSDSGAKRPTQK